MRERSSREAPKAERPDVAEAGSSPSGLLSECAHLPLARPARAGSHAPAAFAAPPCTDGSAARAQASLRPFCVTRLLASVPNQQQRLVTRNQTCCVCGMHPVCGSFPVAPAVLPQRESFTNPARETRGAGAPGDPLRSPVLVLGVGFGRFCFSDFLLSSCLPSPTPT